MKKIVTKEIKIGIAFLVGLFILFFGVKFLKGINIFRPSNNYVVSFENVSGLNISSPVLLNGFKVGMVSSMAIDHNNPKRIVVSLTMDKGVDITKGSKLNLDVSLLGTGSLLLEMNPYSKEIASERDTLVGANVAGLMDTFEKDMAPKVMLMLPKIDSILVGLQTIVNHPALTASLENMDATTRNLQQASKSLNIMVASLNREVPSITRNLSATTGNVSNMTARMNKLEFEKTFSKIDSTMSNIQYISRKFTTQDNSIGLLLNNRGLYDSLNVALGNTSGLLEDFKKNPKKYINLKVF
jgi:phospholipid/cholesterol/gamma-HCH transport system substrate-binding protein